jgi:hypothetical protein
MPPSPPPVRLCWYRLIHTVLLCQMGASHSLASITEQYWCLAQAGIPTRIVADWIDLPPDTVVDEAAWP